MRVNSIVSIAPKRVKSIVGTGGNRAAGARAVPSTLLSRTHRRRPSVCDSADRCLSLLPDPHRAHAQAGAPTDPHKRLHWGAVAKCADGCGGAAGASGRTGFDSSCRLDRRWTLRCFRPASQQPQRSQPSVGETASITASNVPSITASPSLTSTDDTRPATGRRNLHRRLVGFDHHQQVVDRDVLSCLDLHLDDRYVFGIADVGNANLESA